MSSDFTFSEYACVTLNNTSFSVSVMLGKKLNGEA